jgi:DeoR/GlpR family transcriptional regulator of sugar metabolism
MLQEERHHIIINQINLHHKVVTTDLCRLLKVSLDTVRRDLSELEKKGKIVKVHGGAISRSFHLPFQQPEIYAREEKKEIARKALLLIKEGMIILTAGGTIMLELARMIPKNLKCTFFTVSPLVALEIAQRSTAPVILLGGPLSHDAYICAGASVVSQLSEIKADLALVGANGFSLKEGLTDTDWEVVQVKKAIIRSAATTAVLSIEEKIGVAQKLQICPLRSVGCLVTSLRPGDKKLSTYARFVKIL